MTDAPFIAIVDDEEHVRVALRRLCSACDLNPRTFSSAQQLFDSLDHSRPDCLILDVQMPGFGGLDAQAWLLERGINIPAIIITGRDDEEVRVRAAALGACAYLCKPFDVEVLLRAINEALSAGRRAAAAESVAAR
ncbi:MAG TPA: response regulator [Gemmatimonadaceae bacterium]|jgi:two-component system, LuxR family, response regulator FixJ|nr:response regulator [Gemmatimonadaceae bacterium]